MIYIKGVGMTKFDITEQSSYSMVYEAATEALDDSSITMEEVDSVILSNMDIASNGERQRHSASQVSSLFQKKLPILTVPAGCAGGGTALWTAINVLKADSYKNILVVAFDRVVANTSKNVTDEMLMGAERIYEQSEGLNFPAQNALVAQQYMLKYGATTDDFALVALKNHDNAFKNPKARFYGKKVTLENIKNSHIVASPLRLFDCSIPVNGAASLVLSTAKSDVEVIASAEEYVNLSTFEREEMTSWDASRKAGEIAFKQAGVTPSELDIAELHDAFTPVELMSYEDLGFCKRGEAKNLIRKGVTNINGKLPVNTSGGLKAKGHPISATGISQIYEIVRQMRGQAGERQVSNVNCALAQNIGGAGSTATVHILKKV